MQSFVDKCIIGLVKEGMSAAPNRLACKSIHVAQLQDEVENTCKLLVEPEHVKLIVEVDQKADSMQRKNRIQYLKSLQPETMCSLLEHQIALKCVLESEQALADDKLSIEQILNHRTRTFAYTMIFFLREQLMPLFMLGTKGLEHTCKFALAAVILDDAEDLEEDAQADSPTLFTRSALPRAVSCALSILAHLQREQASEPCQGLTLLDTQDFVALAYAKVDELRGGPKTTSIHTKLLLQKLSAQSLNWRGHKVHIVNKNA
jgi:hypothetical protein